MKKTRCYTAITKDQLTEAVRKQARELYEKSGRKPGRDLNNWLEAERIVKSQVCGDLKHMPC